MLGIYWFQNSILSREIETIPGPETLNFCTWNLNSINAHEFICVALLEAYNLVYNYHLIGIVEKYVDSTIDDDRLAINGCTFVKANHPLNEKGGWGWIIH